MTYMLLVIEDGAARSAREPEVAQERFDRMMRYRDTLKARGLLLGSNSLGAGRDAVRVRSRAGERRVIDGPFAEAREIVGGYFLVDCATREQAIALAAECPACEWSTIEVRDLAPCLNDVQSLIA